MRCYVCFVTSGRGRPGAPSLAEDLVDLAAVVGADGLGVRRVGALEEVLAVEELVDQVLCSRARRWPALRGERLVAHLAGHRLARPQGRDVERAEPGDLPEPAASSVLCCGPSSTPSPSGSWRIGIQRLLDPRPEPARNASSADIWCSR